MKKFFLSFFILSLILVAGFFYWFYDNAKAVSGDKVFQNFIIEKGASATQIGSNLQSEGFIKNKLAFKVYLRGMGLSSSLQKGEFRLSPSMNLFEIVSALQKGPIEVWTTIPEGLRREEIAQKFVESLNKDTDFVAEFLDLTKGKEGYLFPDTYLFPREVSAKTVVNKMTANFEEKTKGLNLTYDQVILASMLERETKTDAERPIVAGIIMNRLNNNWPLQIDATNQYATANVKCQMINAKCDWWPILSLDDIERPSPYNTYKNTGYTPAPIANAGISSLKASANPESSDYFFYIHDPSGVIHYAKTLSEHNANIRKYLGK